MRIFSGDRFLFYEIPEMVEEYSAGDYGEFFSRLQVNNMQPV